MEEQTSPTLPNVKDLSGIEENTVLDSNEVVKGTYDVNNILVGWHKELVTPTLEGTK